MEANELRVGNLVATKNGVVVEIILNDFYIEAYHPPHLEHINPIPLTEEWLLKTDLIKKHLDDGGFIEEKDGSRYYAWVDKGVFSLEIQENGEVWFELYSHYKHIKFVHELQNLYFALTGEELIIKP